MFPRLFEAPLNGHPLPVSCNTCNVSKNTLLSVRAGSHSSTSHKARLIDYLGIDLFRRNGQENKQTNLRETFVWGVYLQNHIVSLNDMISQRAVLFHFSTYALPVRHHIRETLLLLPSRLLVLNCSPTLSTLPSIMSAIFYSPSLTSDLEVHSFVFGLAFSLRLYA